MDPSPQSGPGGDVVESRGLEQKDSSTIEDAQRLNWLGRSLAIVVTILTAVTMVALLWCAGHLISGTFSEPEAQNWLNAMAYREWMASAIDHSKLVQLVDSCEPNAVVVSNGRTNSTGLTSATGHVNATGHANANDIAYFQLSDGFRKIVPNNWKVPSSKSAEMASPKTLTVARASYILAALTLSDDVGRSRVDLATQNSFDYMKMQLLQWASIVMGAITTILIGIKATSTKTSRNYLVIGITAIIASSLATGLAGLTSFYLPRVTYQQSSRSLGSLRLLHQQLVESVMRQRDVCRPMTWKGWQFARIKSMTEQYASIMTSVHSSGLAEGAMTGTPEGDEPNQTSQPGGTTGAAARH